MKLGTKIISVLSSVALMTSLMAGCSTGATGDTNPTTSPTTNPTTSPVTVARPDYIPEDLVMNALGFPKTTPLVKINGVDVSAEQILYWASYRTDSLAQYTGGTIDWTMDMGDGTTLQEFVLKDALDTVQLYQVVRSKAEELDCGLTEENKKAYEKDIAELKTNLTAQITTEDPELAYIQWLGTVGLSAEAFEQINQVSYLYNNIREALYGENGKEPVTTESLATWLEESGKLRAKHILVKAVPSEDGSDDGMAAALEKSNTIRAELKAGGDTEAIFDQLMNQYSEDTNPTTNEQNCGPEGYSFGTGEMVPEFEEGTKALQFGQISEPVQSTFGYHIILRLDAATVADQEALKTEYAYAKTDAVVDQWLEEATVETLEAYNTLNIETYYNKLTELRNTIQTVLTPEPSPTVAPTESTTPAEPTATPAA